MVKIAAASCIVAAMLGIALAQQTRPSAAGGPDLSERGRYLVHHVAMCIECHTPRNQRGDLMMGQLLQGARMPVRSPFPQQDWCFEAPHIAGLPGWSDADAVRFLMTGRDYRDYMPRPPMPPFRMSRQDAEAVVAYLKTLH
jgi:mono/diheme cytochrome c family protein